MGNGTTRGRVSSVERGGSSRVGWRGAVALAVVPRRCGLWRIELHPPPSSAAPTTSTAPPSLVHATQTTGVAPESSSGCTRSDDGPGTVTLTPTIDGKVRTAIVHVPTGYGRRPRSPWWSTCTGASRRRSSRRG